MLLIPNVFLSIISHLALTDSIKSHMFSNFTILFLARMMTTINGPSFFFKDVFMLERKRTHAQAGGAAEREGENPWTHSPPSLESDTELTPGPWDYDLSGNQVRHLTSWATQVPWPFLLLRICIPDRVRYILYFIQCLKQWNVKMTLMLVNETGQAKKPTQGQKALV